MNLDLGPGTGQKGEFYFVPRAEICVDLFRPIHKMKEEFIQADAHHLPFRNKSFETTFAFNILEHIDDPYKCIRELQRISNLVLIRQDRIWNLGSYACDSHLWFQLGNLKFIVRYPRTRPGILFAQALHLLMIKEIRIPILWKKLYFLSIMRKCLTMTLNSEKYGQYIMGWHDGKWYKDSDIGTMK